MSWQEQMSLQPASFRGHGFDVVTTSDDITYSFGTHSYPYKAGANIEDTGRDPRRVRMTVVFWQDNYDELLTGLMAVLDQPGSGELIHPIFGTMKVKVVSIGAPFDAAEPNYCGMTVEFIEDALNAPLFNLVTVSNQSAGVDAAIDDAVDASVAPFETAIAEIEAPNAFADKANALLAMKTAIDAMQAEVRALGAPVFGMLSTLTSNVDYIMSPVSFVQDMAGGFEARLSALAGRVDLAMNMPSALVKAVFASGKSVATTAVVPTWTDTRNHLQQPVLDQQYVDADGVMRDRHPAVMVQVQYHAALALARAANDYLASDAVTALTPAEISSVAADARTDIQAAMTAWRGQYADLNDSRPVTEALKRIAVDLQRLAESVINQRPPLIERTTNAPGNLRLIAHWWYADATRADELLRLNPEIQQPNFIEPGTKLSVYAK